ncbi:WemT [Vibrio coralliirubri]|uniref:glycosyltransferase n=1 Tax=Vibrio coralliirubri TaxID=1516159 RepID=UPI000636C541|nr:glycosyltransferase [Vibrio coralliirubri]CDT88177.1 WemT [Vibrio coralliirubri]
MYNEPLVSVYITTHNRCGLLKRAIDSVLSQTYNNIEIIICDDFSSDETTDIVSNYMKDYEFIHYLRNDECKGACYSRNRAIQFANGTFITGLDDDDAFHSDRVRVLVSEYNDDLSFVASDIYVIDKKNKYNLYGNKSRLISYDDIIFFNEAGNQILTKTQRLIDIGGFDENLSSAQDYDLWIRLIERYGSAVRVKDGLYIHYKDHDEPRITTSSRKISGMQDFLTKHESKMSESQIAFHQFRIFLWSKNRKAAIKLIPFIGIKSILFLVSKKIQRVFK